MSRPVILAVLVAIASSATIGSRCLASSSELDEARELERTGELDAALAAYRMLAQTARETDPASAAIALNNSCLILQARGELDLAEEACADALSIRRAAGDRRGTARTLNNLGLVLEGQGRLQEAEDHFDEALRINVERSDLEGQAINLGNLAQLAITSGDYGRALRHLDRVDDLLAGADGADWTTRQRAYNRFNQGVVLEKIGLYDEALSAYIEVEVDAVDRADRPTVALNRGVVYRNLGDPHLALDAFEEALDLARVAGDRRGETFATLNAGIVLDRNLGEPDAARPKYRSALRESTELADVDLELRTRLYLADLDLTAGLASADQEFQAIAEKARHHDYNEGYWRATHGSARAAVRAGDRDEASRRFERTIEILDGVRAGVEASRLGDRFPDEVRPVFVDAVEHFVEIGDSDRAFEIAQLAKRRFRSTTASVPAKVEAIQARLGGSTLLEYFIGRSELYRWTLDASGAEFRRIQHFDGIARRIERLHRALSNGDPPPSGLISALSRELLAGVDPARLGPRILIAPDGRLGYLPFELLPLEGDRLLIDAGTVAYVPSGSAIDAGDADSPPRELAFGGLADPTIDAGRRSSATRQRIQRLGLGALPGAARELARAAEVLPEPSVEYSGEAATEAALVSIAERGTAILHVGAHTLIEEGAGAEAAILLAPTEADDGLLLPEEIAELDLATGLTVLAGCRTAIGFDDRSTALSDLAGAFLQAGSEAVVATLWEVGDESTEIFMQLFYSALARGDTPTEALRSVKNQLREDAAWASPHLWSPYVLIGDGEKPLLPASDRRRVGLWAVLFALLAGGLGWIARHVRSSRS